MLRILTILTLALMALVTNSNAQTNWNMTLVSNVQYQEGCNDIWGYVDSSGVEYAILGTRQATAILSLADPAQPDEIAYIPGSFSTWRDMKTWGHYAYVTADAGADGLLIIDLSPLPDSVTWRYWKPELTVNGNTSIMERCHNIYIDENGYAYLSGCQPLNNGGVIIFDVHSTPGFPTLVGHVENVYSHDNFTRGDTVYSANLTQGFYITDVADKENHITLATHKTSFNFTHNVWLSDDGNYLYTTDERENAFMDAYDISNHNSIKLTDRFQPIDTRQTGVIPHNTHFYQGYNVVSWYTDGVIVVDSHKPDNLVQVANYDTYLGTQKGFQGCWGAYPYLPSQRLLASDINTCLWVFDIDYKRASYLEGIVIDAITKLPLQGATVVIQGGQPNEEISRPNGEFKTGSNQSGAIQVKTELNGYLPNTMDIFLTSGEVTDITIEMVPFQTTSTTGLVRDLLSSEPIEGADVLFVSNLDEEIQFDTLSDQLGQYQINEIYLGNYTVYAGIWGYDYTKQNATLLGPVDLTLELTEGYWDEFLFDYGWTVSGSASRGQWERGVPQPTNLSGVSANPFPALDNGYGNTCFATGLDAGNGVGDFDLDDGTSKLLSPVMVLDEYDNPRINYHYWFVNIGGNGNPDDTLKVFLIHQGEEILVRSYTNSESAWKEDSIIVMDYLDTWDSLQIRFDASDLLGNGHIVECGLDGFRVVEGASVSTENPLEQLVAYKILPNPFQGAFQLEVPASRQSKTILISIVDESGRMIQSGPWQSHMLLGQHLVPGMYFLHIEDGTEKVTLPIVKSVH